MFPREEPEPPVELGLNRPVNPAAVPAPEELQFRTVEAENASGRRCVACGSPIQNEYYQVAGADACPGCALRRKARQERTGGRSEFLRAALFGLGGALAGTALYAVVSLATGMQLSIIAIVVGVIVGKAVLKGSGGCQGKRFQILAVALTYFSITSSFVPLLIHEISKKGTASRASVEAPVQTPPKLTPAQAVGGLAVALTVLIGVALISPFLELASGFGGIINIVIIVIGLRQAWRLTKPDEAAIAGPYSS